MAASGSEPRARSAAHCEKVPGNSLNDIVSYQTDPAAVLEQIQRGSLLENKFQKNLALGVVS